MYGGNIRDRLSSFNFKDSRKANVIRGIKYYSKVTEKILTNFDCRSDFYSAQRSWLLLEKACQAENVNKWYNN